MKSTLPPLTALMTFEAAGRHQSFTKAAAELNVTQAAVSRQVRLLEKHLGLDLFTRAHRSVQLTPEGRDYLHTVVNALAHVGTATVALKARPRAPRLTIGADQSMAALWLLPRLDGFLRDHERMALRLVIDDDERRCLSGEVDVALLHGEGTWATHESRLLFGEDVFPVCSPGHLKARSLAPADLAQETLIDLEDEHWNWMNWRQWLTSHGVEAAAGRPSITIESYPLVVEAARRGLGIALGWRGLVDDDLAAGSLVAPLAETLRSRSGYHVAWPRERKPSPEAAGFIAWVARLAGSRQMDRGAHSVSR